MVRALSSHVCGLVHIPELVSYVGLTAVKREKIAKNKKTTSKERLSLLLFKV